MDDMIDTQMIKLLKLIQKNKGQMRYDQLVSRYPLEVNSLWKLKNYDLIDFRPLTAYGSRTPETKVFATLDGRSYLLNLAATKRKRCTERFLVPIGIGILSYVASKLVDKFLL